MTTLGRNREGQPDLLRYIKKLEERVAKLESNSRLGFSSIDIGGAFTIRSAAFSVYVGGRQVLLIDDDLGVVTEEPGFLFRDAVTGAAVLSHYDDFTAVWNGGEVVLSTDGVSDYGIARPWIPIPVYKDWRRPAVQTTTDSEFQPLQFAKYAVQHPKLYLLLLVYCSLTDTSGEYKIMLGGSQVDGVVNIPVGTWTLHEFGPFDITSKVPNFGDFRDLEVWVRRTAGTGAVGVEVIGAYGRQS